MSNWLDKKRFFQRLPKIIRGCLLAYTIDEVKRIVYVHYLIDPTQDTKARKYR